MVSCPRRMDQTDSTRELCDLMLVAALEARSKQV